MLALFDLGSKVNAIDPTFAKKISLHIRLTDVRAQKIDGTMLDIFRIVVTAFSMTDKANRVKFFEETFLLANVSLEIVFERLFLILNDANIDFLSQKLWWRTYTIKKAPPTTRCIKLVDKKEFVAAALDPEHETYIVYVKVVSSDMLPSSSPFDVHLFWRPQISGLIAKEAPTKIFAKYSDFADVFSPDLTSELPEYTRINNHTIELVDGQQPLYGSIYSLEPIELKTLKVYIETNLANCFIKLSKSPVIAPIMFDQKSDNFFQLCVNYQGLNNLMIKNRYLLPLIGELLDRLKRAKRFT